MAPCETGMYVGIVGAGHAGGAAALALRDMGHTGGITIVGAETAAPYERPSLSKELLQGKETSPRFLASAERWAELGVVLRLGVTATRLDRDNCTLHIADGSALRFDRLIIATGGSARRLPTRRLDAAAIAAHAQRGATALVVGGGVIGLEIAASLHYLGLDVKVVEAGDRLMARNVPADMAARMATIHRDKGISLIFGSGVEAVRPDHARLAIRMTNGNEFSADLVIEGIGITPCVALAAESGLACDDGICVGDRYVIGGFRHPRDR